MQGAVSRRPEHQAALIKRMGCVPRILTATNEKLGRPVAPQDLPDLAQDVLVIIWRKLGEFEGRSSLETWIYRICCFELNNMSRQRSGRQALSLGDIDVAGEVQRDPVDPVELERLYAVLDRLDEDEREIVRMKHFDDLTFHEIGARLGMSTSTAKTRYYRGLRHLWVRLRPLGAEST